MAEFNLKKLFRGAKEHILREPRIKADELIERTYNELIESFSVRADIEYARTRKVGEEQFLLTNTLSLEDEQKINAERPEEEKQTFTRWDRTRFGPPSIPIEAQRGQPPLGEIRYRHVTLADGFAFGLGRFAHDYHNFVEQLSEHGKPFIKPVLEYVESRDGRWMAHFGYENFFQRTIERIPAGARNSIVGGGYHPRHERIRMDREVDQGQPTIFPYPAPGHPPDRPWRSDPEKPYFSIPFDGNTLIWSITSPTSLTYEATATMKSEKKSRSSLIASTKYAERDIDVVLSIVPVENYSPNGRIDDYLRELYEKHTWTELAFLYADPNGHLTAGQSFRKRIPMQGAVEQVHNHFRAHTI